METDVRQFQEEVAEILNKDTWFSNHDIVWLAENTLDIDYQIRKSLSDTGLCAVVTTPEMDYQGEGKHLKQITKEFEFLFVRTRFKYSIWGHPSLYSNGLDSMRWKLLSYVSAPSTAKYWPIGKEYVLTPTSQTAFGTPVFEWTGAVETGAEGRITIKQYGEDTNNLHVELQVGTTSRSSIIYYPTPLFDDGNFDVDKSFDTAISLQLVENPTVNRGKPDKTKVATALEAAHHAVYTLAGFNSGNYNVFSPSTIRQSTVAGSDNKLLQVEARFNTTVIL